MEQANFYIELFKKSFDKGASDDELDEIIETASDNITDSTAYIYFYDNAITYYKNNI